jgi:hypothetical protein
VCLELRFPRILKSKCVSYSCREARSINICKDTSCSKTRTPHCMSIKSPDNLSRSLYYYSVFTHCWTKVSKHTVTSGVHWKACLSFVSLLSHFAILPKLEINRLQYVHRPNKVLIWCSFFGVGHSRTTCSFLGSVVIPSGITTCPRYCTSF